MWWLNITEPTWAFLQGKMLRPGTPSPLTSEHLWKMPSSHALTERRVCVELSIGVWLTLSVSFKTGTGVHVRDAFPKPTGKILLYKKPL